MEMTYGAVLDPRVKYLRLTVNTFALRILTKLTTSWAQHFSDHDVLFL